MVSTAKHTTPPPAPAAHLPRPLARLFEGAEIYGGLGRDDLREMAKFTERPNAQGLPAHPIDRPPLGEPIREAPGGPGDLPRGLSRAICAHLRRHPTLIVRGWGAGASPEPFRVTALVSQSHAHLASGLQAALWPEPAGADPDRHAHLYLLLLPEFEDQLLLHLPEAGMALLLGTDDPRAAMLIALECANRHWLGAAQDAAGGGEASGDPDDRPRLLPGGCFPFASGPEGDEAATLAYCNESLFEQWEATVADHAGALQGRDPAELTLAGAEPWAAWPGGWLCPFWRDPPLPAGLLARAGPWRRAALDPAAQPFGVPIDAAGEPDLTAGVSEEPFVIVPRRAIPAPFRSSIAPLRVGEVLTYRFAQPDAMKLWQTGFPSPRVIGAGPGAGDS